MSHNDGTSMSESRSNANSNNNEQSGVVTSTDVRESTQDHQSRFDTSTTTEIEKSGNHNSVAVATEERSHMGNTESENGRRQQDEGTIDGGDTGEVDTKSADSTNSPAILHDEEFVEVQLSDGQPKLPEGTNSFKCK